MLHPSHSIFRIISAFGFDVDCYVLDDDQKTAVISQGGMGRALGLSHRGNAFPRFLASKGMSGALSAQLLERIQKPLKFQWPSGGAQPAVIVNGFDVTLLVAYDPKVFHGHIARKIRALAAAPQPAPEEKA